MSKSRKKKKPPKRVLALPDLEQAKSAVLNSLTWSSGQRTYDHAINEDTEAGASGWVSQACGMAIDPSVRRKWS
jgi:hypothetical protein